mmetsp:Transcript_32368/g.60932  ORF Transcript_32368/g.60932 Transcript_32368/m.60932 type:complete len:221 (-) Transcript_32368:64-726(-)
MKLAANVWVKAACHAHWHVHQLPGHQVHVLAPPGHGVGVGRIENNSLLRGGRHGVHDTHEGRGLLASRRLHKVVRSSDGDGGVRAKHVAVRKLLPVQVEIGIASSHLCQLCRELHHERRGLLPECFHGRGSWDLCGQVKVLPRISLEPDLETELEVALLASEHLLVAPVFRLGGGPMHKENPSNEVFRLNRHGLGRIDLQIHSVGFFSQRRILLVQNRSP